MKEQCQLCKFWDTPKHQDEMHEDDRYSVCRRYPATYVGHDNESRDMAVQEAAHWAQPVMFATDWCGEFRPKPVPQNGNP